MTDAKKTKAEILDKIDSFLREGSLADRLDRLDRLEDLLSEFEARVDGLRDDVNKAERGRG